MTLLNKLFSFLNKKKPIIKSTEIDNLLPFVRPLWWFESHILSGYANTSSDIFFIPYESDLGIGFCLVNQEALKILERDDIEKYDTTEEHLLSISMENLLKKSNSFSKASLFTEVYQGVWSSSLLHLSSSGLILLKQEIDRLKVFGKPNAFFVGKNQVLITGSNDTAGILYCMLAIKNLEHTSFISGNVYTLDKNQWHKTKFTRGKIGIVNEYLESCMTSYVLDTNKFMNILEERNDVSDNFQISEINLGWKDNQSFLYTPWIKAAKNWLPKVDRIILIPSPQQNHTSEELDKTIKEQTFDWEVVASIYSHKMKQLDYFHEIWDFADFPTQEEIEKMKQLQIESDATARQ